MRVGIAISRYRRSGGLERVSGEWARGLASRGHDVTVFTQLVEPSPGDDQIRFVRVGGLHSPIAARAATFPRRATKAARRAGLDAVISFGCTVLLRGTIVRLPGAHRPWWDLANALDPPTTYPGLRRRLNPHHRIVLAWENRVLTPRIARAVLAASEIAADDIMRLYPGIASRVLVVPDGIDPAAFAFDPAKREAMRSAWDASDAFVVLTVATEVRRKGIASLLEAFTHVLLQRRDALLVVAGTAPQAEVERLAAERGLSHRVRAVGFVPDVAAAYAAADLFVFPTLFDPWGLPVVEALACGTPVACSIDAGSSQVVAPGENGLLIDSAADALALAHTIVGAAALPLDRERNRASVERLAWPKIVDLVEDILARSV